VSPGGASRAGARDTDCFVDDIFADGVSIFGAVEEVIAEFWVIDVN